MPISKVDENMKRAQKRDAVLTERFWWRKDIFTVCEDTSEPEITEMSIDEIFNGIPGSDYQGLIALVRDYLRGQDSRVSEEAVYDLLVAIDQIQRGVRKEPSLFV